MQPMHRAILDVVHQTLSFSGVKRATKYLLPTVTVKATRLHKLRMNERASTIVVTVGKPNYAEREFIKRAKRAGEPFPIKRIQLKFWKVA